MSLLNRPEVVGTTTASNKKPIYDNTVNPDASIYVRKELTQEQLNRGVYAGIQESFWVPIPTPFPPARREFTPRSLHDLRGYTPTQLGFTMEHPREDRKDEWFARMLEDLFFRTKSFAEQQFGTSVEYTTSPWTANFSPQFVDFASQIARCDQHVGGWDTCLKDESERIYLVLGIISKVLDDAVFSELLFGCDDQNDGVLNNSTRTLLDKLDQDMLQEGGYFRKDQRAVHVRRILSGRIVPGQFWVEVDRLATQTTAMLLPLINLQGKLTPNHPWPKLVEVHQEVHNIIAQAGYTAVCMSWSKSIFRFTFPNPGQYWNQIEMNHFDDSIYKTSQEQAISYDEAQLRLKTANSPPSVAENGQTATGNDATQGSAPKDTKLPFRVAKVKIAMWPLVQRHKPIGTVDGCGAEGGEKISRITQAQVVYYHGLSTMEGEATERYSLHDYRATFTQAARSQRRFDGLFLVTILFIVYWYSFMGVEELKKDAAKLSQLGMRVATDVLSFPQAWRNITASK